MPLLYISPLIIGLLLGSVLVNFLARNRRAPGATALIALILAAALWSLGYALEIMAPGLQAKLFWAKFQYLGIVTIPLAWLIFVARYLGPSGSLVRLLRYPLILVIVPALTLGLVWTNELHGVVWQQVQLVKVGPVQMLEIHHGPWFWVNVVYGYILMFVGSIPLAGRLLGSVHLHRSQIWLALLAILVPWLGNLVYISSFNPVEHLDWTPFSFVIAGLLFVLSLYRFHLVDILPIAQKTVFDGLADCLLVLDLQNNIVDLNQSAKKMSGYPGKEALGNPITGVLPELDGWLLQAGSTEEFHVELTRGEGLGKRFFDLRISPLSGPYPVPIGRLVVCHEITQHKQEQARLEQAVSERTEALRQAVDQLQGELAQRVLAEKRFADVVEFSPDALLLLDQDGVVLLANARAVSLFGYACEELVGQTIKKLIPTHRRAEYLRYLKRFVANPALQNTSLGLNLSTRRKDGSEFPAEISLGPLYTTEGVSVACSVRDVTERVEAGQARDRLLAELQQSHEALRLLSFRLQEAREHERRQIAAELHDRVGQNLTGLNLNLQVIQTQLNQAAGAAIQKRLQDSLKLVEETTRQVREVMVDLHPPLLEEYGLVSALHWYGDKFSQQTCIAAEVLGTEFEPRLAMEVELVLFRIVQEALNNVAKHARASQVVIRLEASEEAACLVVEDDGQGFDPRDFNGVGEQPHWGLLTMQQRAASIGGELAIDSAPGRGTRVSVSLRRRSDGD